MDVLAVQVVCNLPLPLLSSDNMYVRLVRQNNELVHGALEASQQLRYSGNLLELTQGQRLSIVV